MVTFASVVSKSPDVISTLFVHLLSLTTLVVQTSSDLGGLIIIYHKSTS